MEKGFREVLCPPPCGQKLRLKISKEQYGKKVEVTCPKCHLKFTTTIPTPAIRPAGKASDSFDDDPFDFLEKFKRKIFGCEK